MKANKQMQRHQKRIIYTAMIFILLILIYVTGSKLYFKNIFFLHGNSGKTVWESEDLQKTGHDFQLQDDGSFLSRSSDPWFTVEESFSVKTILLDIREISEKHDAQVFFYSDNEELDAGNSYYFQLKEGINYLQIPEKNFHKFRLDLTDHSGIKLGINSITLYGSRVVPARFLISIITAWGLLSWILYRKMFLNKKIRKCAHPSTPSEVFQGKIHSLSYLRVLALGMILYDHLCGMRNSDWILKKAVDFILCTPLNIIQDFGALGVSLFYLITGFLFLHTNRKKENGIASACRKVIRLYLFTLISTVIFGIFQYGFNSISPTYWAQFSLKDWTGCATLISYFSGVGDMVNGTTWFLIPLFAFYILSSICYKFSGKNISAYLLLLEGISALLVILGIYGSRQANTAYLSSLIPFIYIPIIGVIVYLWVSHMLSCTGAAVSGGIAYITMTLAFYRLNRVYYAENPYIISIICAALLLLLFIAGEHAFKEQVIITFLEKISLSLYLVHMTWGSFLMSFLESRIRFSLSFILTLGFLIFVAWLHYRLIETGLLKKFNYKT